VARRVDRGTGDAVVNALTHAAHRVRVAVDARLRADGLSLSSFKLLDALVADPLSMREVSDLLHVAPRTVTDLIDGLEAHGLVARRPHPSDRRVTLLEVTEQGASRYRQAKREADIVRDAAVCALDDNERRTLIGLLERIGGS
jgi:DNA-binding MarR family transcriptional regulator